MNGLYPLYLYPSSWDQLNDWCVERQADPTEVAELLIDRYLDNLNREFPRTEINPEEEREAIMQDLRYEERTGK